MFDRSTTTLSEREHNKVLDIELSIKHKSKIEKARSYDDDVNFLLQLLQRASIVQRMTAEEKIELKDLRSMRKHVIKFAHAIGLNGPAMG